MSEFVFQVFRDYGYPGVLFLCALYWIRRNGAQKLLQNDLEHLQRDVTAIGKRVARIEEWIVERK